MVFGAVKVVLQNSERQRQETRAFYERFVEAVGAGHVFTAAERASPLSLRAHGGDNK